MTIAAGGWKSGAPISTGRYSAGSSGPRVAFPSAFKTHFVTPETDEIGVGDIKEERMAKAIKLLVETYGLSSAPAVKDVFDRSFLPPKEARMLKLNM